MRTLSARVRLALASALVVALPRGPARAEEPGTAQSWLTMDGQGEAMAPPDLAEVEAGVVTQARTATEALRENSEAMARLHKALQARGIADRDVLTTQLQVTPQYPPSGPGQPPPPPEIVGYRVSNVVRVRVRPISSLGGLLDAMVAAGANQVQGIRLLRADPAAVLDRARQEAVSDARRRAELYARAIGVRLVRVLTVREQGAPPPVSLAPRALVLTPAEAVPIAAGEQSFRASVQITWAIEPAAPMPTR